MHKLISHLAALGVLISLSIDGHAGIIDAYPDPTLPTFGGYSAVGEVSSTNPSLSINSGHNFATFFGQTFTALPGLAESLTFNLRGDPGDGIDFRLLIAQTTPDTQGTHRPVDIVYASPNYTLGSALGQSGIPVLGSDVTINLGGFDLIDGAIYAWILDTVSTSDGIEGYGSISYRHPAQVNFLGNSSVLVWDLDLNQPVNNWINIAEIDLAYRLEFANGGIAVPIHNTLAVFPYIPVPEPSTLLLLLAGSLYVLRSNKVQCMLKRRPDKPTAN